LHTVLGVFSGPALWWLTLSTAVHWFLSGAMLAGFGLWSLAQQVLIWLR